MLTKRFDFYNVSAIIGHPGRAHTHECPPPPPPYVPPPGQPPPSDSGDPTIRGGGSGGGSGLPDWLNPNLPCPAGQTRQKRFSWCYCGGPGHYGFAPIPQHVMCPGPPPHEIVLEMRLEGCTGCTGTNGYYICAPVDPCDD